MSEFLREITIMKNGIPNKFLIPNHTEEIAAIRDSLANKAEANHEHTGYANANHEHDFYTKEEIDEKIAAMQNESGGGNVDLSNYCTKSEAQNDFAPRTHTHTEFARLNHTHTGFAPVSHTHPDYALKNHNHNETYYTKEEVDQKVADMQSGGEVDLSNYYNKQETYSKTEVDAKIDEIPQSEATDLTNYYNKQEIDAKIMAIQNEVGLGTDTTTLYGILKNTKNDVTIYVNYGNGTDNILTNGLTQENPLNSLSYALSYISKMLNGREIRIFITNGKDQDITLNGFVGGRILIRCLDGNVENATDPNAESNARTITISNCTSVYVEGLFKPNGFGVTVSNCSFISFTRCVFAWLPKIDKSTATIEYCTLDTQEGTFLFENSDITVSNCKSTGFYYIYGKYSTFRLGEGNDSKTIAWANHPDASVYCGEILPKHAES